MRFWILFDRETLVIDHFRWFGDRDPRAVTPSLGERAAKNAKANSEGVKTLRPGIRTLVWSDFTRVETTPELASLFFPKDSIAPGPREDPKI